VCFDGYYLVAEDLAKPTEESCTKCTGAADRFLETIAAVTSCVLCKARYGSNEKCLECDINACSKCSASFYLFDNDNAVDYDECVSCSEATKYKSNPATDGTGKKLDLTTEIIKFLIKKQIKQAYSKIFI
jgi:hypothetical protein